MNEIVIFYTNECNVCCPHCFISPLHNDGYKIMSVEILEKSLKYAEYIDSDRIVFSGGEPIIHRKLLLESLSKITYKSSLKFSLCTNGFWGNDGDRKILEELKEYNFDTLEVSTDTFHQNFISLEEKVIPLIKNAISLGFRVIAIVCFEDILKEAGTISKLNFIIKGNGTLHLRPISNFGSALKNQLKATKLEKIERCTAAGELCIRYDGQSFICCGPPIVYNLNEFCVGNIMELQYKEIYDRFKSNKIVQLMQSENQTEIQLKLGETMESSAIDSLCHRCIRFSQC